MTSQIARFVRLFLFAVAPALTTIATGQSKLTVAVVEAAVVPALEVAWRGIHPTFAAKTTYTVTFPPAGPDSGPVQPV